MKRHIKPFTAVKLCLIWYFESTTVYGWVGSNRYQEWSRRIAISSSASAADTSDRLTGEQPELVDLQTHTIRKSPAETLADLSSACQRLGIDTFDVYGDFDFRDQSYLRQFEAEVAECFGKEDAIFCLSGGMAQSIVLAINAKKCATPNSSKKKSAFACHPTSHLLLHENNAYSELLGMEAVIIGDSQNEYNPDVLKENGCYGMEPIRLSHVEDLLNATNDTATLTYPNLIPIHNLTANEGEDAVLSTLIIELPHREIGGKLTPWDEVEEISHICRSNDIHYHCDGARIFEASAGYGHESVKETAEPFSSIYISFYKGLGSITGAMLIGDSEFCQEARVWLRRMGGNLYSVLPYYISSWDGFRKNCKRVEPGVTEDSNETNKDHLLSQERSLVYDKSIFEARQKKLARVLKLLHEDTQISSIVQFDPVVPEVNIVHGYLRMTHDECLIALGKVEHNFGTKVLNRVRKCSVEDADDQKFGCRFEWTMGESNSLIEDEYFVQGWKAFAQAVLVASNID